MGALLFLLLGMGLGALHLASPWQSYLKVLPRAECSVHVRVRVLGTLRHSGGRVFMRLGVTELRYGEEWTQCRGTLYGIFPLKYEAPYGTQMQIRGAVTRMEGGFADYSKSLGMRRSLHVTRVERVIPARGWRRGWACFLSLREDFAVKLCEGIANPLHADIYRAMILGMRDSLPQETREAFVKSATVHLFSISGLHVSLLALFLAGVTKVFPVRYRLAVVSPLLFAYVLMCGGAPSALRAYWMSTGLLLARLRLRSHSTENSLALSGLLLLMWNPLYLLHSGFLFSFTLVLVLLRGMRGCCVLTAVLTEKRLWLPRTLFNRTKWNILRTLLGNSAGSALACLGSWGLAMRFNGLISFSSIVINVLLSPIALILVWGSIPKLVAAYLCPPLSLYMGVVLDKLLLALLMMSEVGAMPGMYAVVPVPSWGAVMVYYLLLLCVLSRLRPALLRILCLGVLLAGTFFAAHRKIPPSRSGLMCISGSDGGAACLVLLRPGGEGVVVLQPGGLEAAKRMLAVLKETGRTDAVRLAVPDKGSLAGAWCIIAGADVCSLAYNEKTMPRVSSLVRRCRREGIHVSVSREGRCSLGSHVFHFRKSSFPGVASWECTARDGNPPIRFTADAGGESVVTWGDSRQVLRPSLKPHPVLIPASTVDSRPGSGEGGAPSSAPVIRAADAGSRRGARGLIFSY